jgi:hypothetical protein
MAPIDVKYRGKPACGYPASKWPTISVSRERCPRRGAVDERVTCRARRSRRATDARRKVRVSAMSPSRLLGRDQRSARTRHPSTSVNRSARPADLAHDPQSLATVLHLEEPRQLDSPVGLVNRHHEPVVEGAELSGPHSGSACGRFAESSGGMSRRTEGFRRQRSPCCCLCWAHWSRHGSACTSALCRRSSQRSWHSSSCSGGRGRFHQLGLPRRRPCRSSGYRTSHCPPASSRWRRAAWSRADRLLGHPALRQPKCPLASGWPS